MPNNSRIIRAYVVEVPCLPPGYAGLKEEPGEDV
jgi:hypothetical protein